jgi:hypothetical protein
MHVTLERVKSGVCLAQKRKTAPYGKAGGGFTELEGQREQLPLSRDEIFERFAITTLLGEQSTLNGVLH